MQLKFDANQEFQIRAIESIANIFEGQPRNQTEMRFASKSILAAIANNLDLSEDDLLLNLQIVQTENGLPIDGELMSIEKEIEVVDGRLTARFFNFSVEMETGTGKTYVYLRTAFELFRRYGLRKYIVVVPSVAIREGVLKTLEITEKHLRELYDNTPCRYYTYDSANLSQVRQFALSDSIEIMVMTIDSFNKASNVINQTTDRLQGETPIHLVQTARPILILDEPQNMESELRIAALAALNPLFAMRYSATHRNPYNLVYRLTPFEAYRQGLVKRIEVAGAEEEQDESQAFLRLDDIKTEKKTITARIAIHKLMAGGTVKEQIVTVRPGDSLEEKANRQEYADFVVEEISVIDGCVIFSNGTELRLGETQGADKQAIYDAQIRYTIGEHLRKHARLKNSDIKVLSLFFIDRVDNYARQDGIIRRIFNRAFNDLKKNTDWEDIDPEKVQAAYFASRRTKTGEVVLEDSRTGESEKDRVAYDLIMRDKERLLSFDEPTCFIFSHSALREGWDNPNIFQICTLREVGTERERRQQIGRGVRLAVNQNGDRVRDEHVNVLTVIANENFEKYVSQYQSEIEKEFGVEGLPPRPANARRRVVAHLRKEYMLKPEFKELWELIKHKTRYAVKLNSGKLIGDVVTELEHAVIRPPQVVITKGRVETEGEGFTTYRVAERKIDIEAERKQLPNITFVMSSLLERTTPPIRVTRKTLLEIFKRLPETQQKAALDNPYEFSTVAVRIIKAKLANQIVDGIQYEKIDAWYEMTQFQEIPSWEDNLVPSPHSLYDQVIYDSEIEKEFVEGLEHRDDVKLYVKLPGWFTVPTPIGEYNPDWAIVLEQRDEFGQAIGEPLLYLVRETKSTTNLDQLRQDEKGKVICGQKHFEEALGVNYRVVTNAKDLF